MMSKAIKFSSIIWAQYECASSRTGYGTVEQSFFHTWVHTEFIQVELTKCNQKGKILMYVNTCTPARWKIFPHTYLIMIK